MAAVTIRNLPDETLRALKTRAKGNGRSAEAEIRAILQEVTQPAERIKIGSELAVFGRKLRGVRFEPQRDPRPTEAAKF